MTSPAQKNLGEFTSVRLLLRPPHKADTPFLCGLYADPELMRRISGKALDPRQAEDKAGALLADWQQHGYGMFILSLRAAPDRPIGYCGFKMNPAPDTAELGYIIAKPYWGQGLAREAVRRCMRIARDELGLQRLVAMTAPDAAASQRILTKLGFERVERATGVEPKEDTVYFECGLRAG